MLSIRKFFLVIAVSGLVAAPSAALLGGNQDLIWDAFHSVNGIDLEAKYKESPENGRIDQTLEVEIQDAPPRTLVFVEVEGRNLGSFVTDAFGDGSFRMDVLGLPPTPEGRAPKPRIETGHRVRVHDGNVGISAVFQPRP